MARLKRSNEQILEAIKGTNGIIKDIAGRLGVTRETVNAWIRKYPTIRDAYDAEKAIVDDWALSNVSNAIIGGDLPTSLWWLKMKMGSEFHETQKLVYEVDWDDSEGGPAEAETP